MADSQFDSTKNTTGAETRAEIRRELSPNPPKIDPVLPPVIPSPPLTPSAIYVPRSTRMYAGPERRLPNNSPYDGTERRIRYTDGKKIIELKSDQVSLSLEEEERVKEALDLLAKDPHAPREIMVRFTLHIFNEWPKTLHKHVKKVSYDERNRRVVSNVVESRSVKNADEESKAGTDGFGKFEVPKDEPVSEETGAESHAIHYNAADFQASPAPQEQLADTQSDPSTPAKPARWGKASR